MSNWKWQVVVGISLPLIFVGQADSQPLFSKQADPTELLEQAQKFERQGVASEVIGCAKKALALLQVTQNPSLTAFAWAQLGNGYLLKGDFAQAEVAYQESIVVAQDLDNPELQNAAAQGLALAQQQRSYHYSQQAQLIKNPEEQSGAAQQARRANLNAQQYLTEALVVNNRGFELVSEGQTRDATQIQSYLQALKFGIIKASDHEDLIDDIQRLPPSRNKVFFLLQASSLFLEQQPELLHEAIANAQSIPGDPRTEAEAWLDLGEYQESQGKLIQAQESSQRAQWLAQQTLANDDLLYEAYWLAARTNKALGFENKALKKYQDATAALNRVRDSLSGANRDFQLDFRDNVEPVYRQYLEMLLEKSDRKSLETALEVVDDLKLAQLEDFFGSPCTEIDEEVDPEEILAESNAALITSIILPEQTYLILQTPDGDMKSHSVNVTASELAQMLEDWRVAIDDIQNYDQHQEIGTQLYRLMIEPLELNGSSALIFNNDGVLRNAPLAALYDGENYLIQKYPLATTLGLKLDQPDLEETFSDPLIFGLSVPTDSFGDSLANVKTEVEQLHDMLGGKQLLNEEYTAQKAEKTLEENDDYRVIHFATHAEFGGTAETSYLESYNEPIDLNELELMLSQSQIPLNLLVFSACETVSGNERAVLGMAGVGLRAGVQSTLGNLWDVPDRQSTTVEMVTQFYAHWKDGMTKAEALQQAQLSQIEQNRHASGWAGTILLGDWG